MPTSLSTNTCAPKTLAWKTKMLSSIEMSYLIEMQQTLSTDTCAVKTFAWHHTSAKKHHNAYLIEMPQSLSTNTCAAKTLAWKTKMWSSIENTHLMEMQESLSIDACAAKMLAWHHTSAKMSITGKRDLGWTCSEPINSEWLLSGLAPIDGTRFEAKPLWQNPFSYGYRANKHK